MSWNDNDGNGKGGPWGSRNQNPWGDGDGGRRQGGGRGPHHGRGGPEGPDIDEMLKQASDRISKTLGGGGGRGIAILFVILALVWGATGFYRVLPEENAVITTFGKWTSTREAPGLGYAIPWPIQQVQKVNVSFVHKMEIGFRGDSAGQKTSRGVSNETLELQQESLMLTGDENIIDIDFVVLWRISDAKKYLFEIRDPENTIKKVAESAMREVIGRTDIQPALTEARGLIEDKTRELMQKMLDEYLSGVLISDIQLQKVDPPGQVIKAFDDVQSARQDMDTLRNKAEAYRNDILPKARGEKERLLQEAQAYREEVVNRATGDAERFLSVYKAYAQAKDVTAERIYLETMQEIMEKTQKVIIDNDKDGMGVLPYLPLDKLREQSTGTRR